MSASSTYRPDLRAAVQEEQQLSDDSKQDESIPGDGLSMPPEEMLELAEKTARLIVERIESLPRESAWEGDFRQELEAQLGEDPPESGRPAAEVLARAARQILPVAARIDHPRFFGFIPSSTTWPGVLAISWSRGTRSTSVPG